MDNPNSLLLLLSISVFLLFLFYTFSLSFPYGRLGFRAHVKIASRIVSYPQHSEVMESGPRRVSLSREMASSGRSPAASDSVWLISTTVHAANTAEDAGRRTRRVFDHGRESNVDQRTIVSRRCVPILRSDLKTICTRPTTSVTVT